MTYTDYRRLFNTAEEFEKDFGNKSEEEAKALISTIQGSAAIKAAAFSKWREAHKRCERERLQSINRFASKWLDRFNDPTVQYIELVDHWMADDCRALGFEMDCGTAFSEKYAVAFNDCDALCKIIDEITDISLLGSAVYSKWRYFNHWAYSGDEILEPKNKKWFVTVLSRLKALTV